MCLTPIHKNVKTAKEDILCYKILKIKNTHLISPFTHYRWYPNKLVVVSKLRKDEGNEINEGLHAYVDIFVTKIRYCWLSIGSKMVIYNAIIPKGSKYYLGEDGDIVSNQMMITGRYKN